MKFVINILIFLALVASTVFYAYASNKEYQQTERWDNEVVGNGYWLSANNRHIESFDLVTLIEGTTSSLTEDEQGDLSIIYTDIEGKLSGVELPRKIEAEHVVLLDQNGATNGVFTPKFIDFEEALPYLNAQGNQFSLAIVNPLSGTGPDFIQEMSIIL